MKTDWLSQMLRRLTAVIAVSVFVVSVSGAAAFLPAPIRPSPGILDRTGSRNQAILHGRKKYARTSRKARRVGLAAVGAVPTTRIPAILRW